MLPPFPLDFLALPDEQLALAFYAYRTAVSLESVEIEVEGVPLAQVQADQLPPGLLPAIYMTAVLQPQAWQLGQDTGNENLTGLEKALRLTQPDCSGNVSLHDLRRAGGLIRQFFVREGLTRAALDEAVTGRRRQRALARRKRPPSYLRRELTKMVRARPRITAPEAIDKLERLVVPQASLDPYDDPKIEQVDRAEGVVDWSEPKGPQPLSKSAPLSGIPKMLSSIRKELGISRPRKSKSR